MTSLSLLVGRLLGLFLLPLASLLLSTPADSFVPVATATTRSVAAGSVHLLLYGRHDIRRSPSSSSSSPFLSGSRRRGGTNDGRSSSSTFEIWHTTQQQLGGPVSSRAALGGGNNAGDDDVDFSSDLAPPPLFATTAAASASAPGAAEERAAERRGRSWILLVDDEEPIRTAVGRLLVDRGYNEVSACEDGSEALRMATSRRTTVPPAASSAIGSPPKDAGDDGDDDGSQIPDCIVSDVRMPGMDGLELLRQVRTHPLLYRVPVVLLTAKGLTQDRIDGYDSGADAYLSKPFAPDELVAVVDSVIERSDAVREGDGSGGGNAAGTVKVDDLKRDLDEIKNLLLNKGGGGVGNGWVEQTNVFLTKEEQEVLELLAQGLMTKEIAAKSYLSTRRIEQLLTRMFRKTGSRNRTELVRWAVSTGNVQ